MDTYHTDMEARVWQRVRGETAAPGPRLNLTALLRGEHTDAAAYLALSRRLQGQASALLHRLWEEELTHVACLKGICVLTTGERPVIPPEALPQEPTETTLRRCYRREMTCIAAYEACAGDREYGPVFARLAQQELSHCQIILQVLGGME